MLQFIITFLIFSLALTLFIIAIKFSKYKNKQEEECEEKENCELKKMGIKDLKCDD